MKIFGNSKRRPTSQNREKEPERRSTPQTSGSPLKALILFCGALGIFVGVIIMCLTLINRSEELAYQPPETEIKALEYVVNALPGETTEPTQPMPELSAPEGMNDSDILNILFLAPDSTTGRTDTLLLLKLDLNTKELALLSIPRDTYISGNYELPKLHQVYHAADGGERGSQAVKEKVKEMIGFWPDYYFVLDQQAISLMMGQAGGSFEFELPASPAYTDLPAGKQNIAGANALKLLQYRDDYTQIETDSTKIQRDFFVELLERHLAATKDVMAVATELSEVADTDLSVNDIAYLIDFLKKANLNSIYSTVFDGKEIKVDKDVFYQIDVEKAVTLLNSHFNPTEEELSIYDVNFRQKTGDSGEGKYSDFGFPTTPSTTKPSDSEEPNPTDSSSPEGNTEPSAEQQPTDPPTNPTDTPPQESAETP